MWLHFLLILVIPARIGSDNFRLSVPKVLLPYRISTPVNYTLEITGGGCLNWKSSRPEVAQVIQPVGELCSRRVVISAVSPHPYKMTAVITAEDPITGNVLRCDVIVDAISEIEIITTTRELFLEDAPEMFSVQARNAQGDTFSDLGGLKFNWNLVTDMEVDPGSRIEASQVLRIIPFANAKYESVAAIRALEARGLQGHSILIEGFKSGSAYVSAQLLDEPYRHIPATKIGLVVIAHLMLNPSWDLYVPLFSTVHYKVELIRQTRAQEVKMPSSQYQLHLTNTSVGQLNEKTSNVFTSAYGSTEIILKDRSVQLKSRQTIREATAGLHVVMPKYLGFKVDGGNNWVVQKGKEYEITTEVFDFAGRSLYLTDNVRVEVHFPPEYFSVFKQSLNGTVYTVKTIKSGAVTLDGAMLSVIKPNGEKYVIPDPGVKGSQLVEIFDLIVVSPPVVVLPYDPHKSQYQIKMAATGGSGKYLWSTDNSASVSIGEYSGLLTSVNFGSAKITAVDIRNEKLRDTADAHVIHAAKLSFLPHHVESEIGQQLRIPIEVSGVSGDGTKVKATDCSLLDVKVEMKAFDGTNAFDYVGLEKSNGSGCAVVVVKAMKKGDTIVRATYKLTDQSTTLDAEVLVSAFYPLKVVEQSGSPLVSVGSSMLIRTTGGPKPWKLDGSRHFAYGSIKSVSIAELAEEQDEPQVFRILCLQQGTVELGMSVGNKPTSSNPFPLSSDTSIQVHCGFPVSLEVAEEPLRLCQLGGSGNLPVYNKETLTLRLIAKDGSGKTFSNVSSLLFDWSVIAGSDLGRLEPSGSVAQLKMLGRSGLMSIVVQLKEFRDVKCVGKKCHQQKLSCSASINLQAVDHATLDTASISVFNHPANKVSLNIHGGSGQFRVVRKEGSKPLAQLTIADGVVVVAPLQSGTEVLELVDMCLPSAPPMPLELFISDLHRLEISGPTLVGLGKKIQLTATAFDERGVKLGEFAYRLITVVAELDKKGIVYTKVDGTNINSYWVFGNSVGSVSYTLTSVNPTTGKVVMSKPHVIHVYRPLQLSPKEIYLLVGAKFQLDISGGPELQGNVHFKLNQTGLATVSATGIIAAETVGHVKVVGQITQHDEVLSEDSVVVHIYKLSGISLMVGTTKLEVGAEMPVIVTGMGPNETPMSFGGMANPLRFKWTIDNVDVATLESVYHNDGYPLVSDSQISKRLLAHKNGLVTVTVTLIDSNNLKGILQKGAITTDSIQILMVDGLMVNSFCSSLLLMTPLSSFQLKTNRDATSVHFQVVSTATKDSLVTVDKNGLVTTKKSTGEATIIVTAKKKNSEEVEVTSVSLEVKPVAYLMFTAKPNVKSTKPMAVLPVGHRLEVSVSYHDSVGRIFNAVAIQPVYQANIRDLIELNSLNNSLHLKHSGEAILGVGASGGSLIGDFISVPIGSVIEPMDERTYRVGDVICFNSSIEKTNWKSSAHGILEVDSTTGVGVAKSPGVTTVSLGSTGTEVTVSPLSHLSFIGHPYRYITNVGQKAYRLPFGSGANETNLRGDCLSAIRESVSRGFTPLKSPDFKCQLEWAAVGKGADIPSALSLFSVTAEFDIEAAAYSCLVKKLPLENDVDMFNAIDADMIITVTKGKQSDRLTLPFYPAFKVSQTELSLNNLHSSQAVLSISGSPKVLTQLTVTGNKKNVLVIGGPESDPSEPHRRQFVVQLDDKSSAVWTEELSDLAIQIRCALSGQNVVIPVKVKLFGQAPRGILAKTCPSSEGFLVTLQSMWDSHYSVLMWLLTIVITSIVVIIGYRYLLSGQGYATPTNPPGVFASDSAHGDTGTPANIPWRSYASPTRSPGGTPFLWSLNSPQQNSRNSPRTSSPLTSFNRSSS